MLIKCTITGITPLLCNRFTDEAQLAVQHGTSAVIRGQKPSPMEQARAKLYTDAEGRLVLPGPNVFAALVDAGKFIKTGKTRLTTARSSLVPAGLTIGEVDLPLSPNKWVPDSRPVVIPATGGRMIAHRPRFDAWGVTFTLEIDGSLFSASVVRELVDLAGMRIGLGDFRPARKGPFGRFKVTSWKEQA